MKQLLLDEVYEWFKALNQVKYDNPRLSLDKDGCVFATDYITLRYWEAGSRFRYTFNDNTDFPIQIEIISTARSEVISFYKSLEVVLASNRFHNKKRD